MRGPAETPPILDRVKLIMAIAHNEDAGAIIDGLLEREFRATRVQSSGGFLRKSNATILVGVPDSNVDEVVAVIRANSEPRTDDASSEPVASSGESRRRPRVKVDLRPAIVFVLPIERVERL
jgi:uncharacterized protein YaaQ